MNIRDADKHKDLPQLRGRGEQKPWSAWVVTAGMVIIILFHCALGRLIYVEFFKNNDFKESKRSSEHA